MAHAGGVKPCVAMQVIDNELWQGRPEQTTIAMSEVDEIVERLKRGEKVYVELYGGLQNEVYTRVQRLLAEG